MSLLSLTGGHVGAATVIHSQGEPPLGPSYYVVTTYVQLAIADLCEVPKPERLDMETALSLRRQAMKLLKFPSEKTAYVESNAQSIAAQLIASWQAKGRYWPRAALQGCQGKLECPLKSALTRS